MTIDPTQEERLRFLLRIVGKELKYLQQTDTALFAEPFTVERASELEHNQALAEQVDAFVGRYGRLQDTLGDKFLPRLLEVLGEQPRVLIDNLDKAEKFGWIESADQWMSARRLRNKMIHEYMEDHQEFTRSLTEGHDFVPLLAAAVQAMSAELSRHLKGGA